MRGTQAIGISFVVAAITIATMAALALANGCSAFGADTTNTASSEQDAATSDSNTIGTSTLDGSAADDGGRADDAATALCAKERVLDTEAFTGTPFPPAGWVDVNGGGTVERDPSVFHLAAGSLKAACTPAQDGNNRAYIQHGIPVNPAAVDLQFWVRVSNLPMNNYAEVGCSLRLTNAGGELFRLSLFITESVIGMQTGAVINPNPPTNDLPINIFTDYEAGWYEVRERVTPNINGTVTFTVTVRNSTTQRTETINDVKLAPKVSDAVGLHCGISYADRNVPTATPMDVNVDDIVLSVCPR